MFKYGFADYSISGEFMGNVTIAKDEYFELLRYKEMVRVFEDLLHEPKFKKEFEERALKKEFVRRLKEAQKGEFVEVKDFAKKYAGK